MAADPEALAAAVEGCPSVAALHSGGVGEVATYLPGRRVSGVRVSDEGIELHVVARWDRPLPAVADEIRAAVEPLRDGAPVDIVIADVEGPDDTPKPETPAP